MPGPRYTNERRTSDLSESRPPPTQPAIPRRVLACVNCQKRKVKCDRKVPCANCTKSRVQCVPATKVSRGRRRRFSEQELLERLEKYERLLTQNYVEFEPLHGDTIKDKEPPNEEPGLDSDNEQSRTTSTDGPSHPNFAVSKASSEHKNFVHNRNQQFWDSNARSDTSEDDLPHSEFKKALDLIFENDDHLLFGSRGTAIDISSLHPEPVQIFRLWQIYLENVNPLLKVTHAPSLQGRFIEAAANISKIRSTLEALMFGIYSMAILSLAVDECESIFGLSKLELLTRYQFGCEQALINSSFLRTDDRDCLTAMYLYLVSARSRTNPRSLSSLLGIAIRIAQRMGIHTESALTKCTPLEAEMGRRLWWSLILFDTRIGEMADSKASSLTPIWDCKVPLNVNDSDLVPEMKDLPSVQAKFSDALFAVIRSELGEFVRHSAFHLGLNCPAWKSTSPVSPELYGNNVLALENLIEDKYLQFCDPENPLHFTTIWMTRGYLAKCRLIEHRFQHSKAALPQSDEDRESAVSYAISMIECDTKIASSTLTRQFHWLSHSYFPFPAYLHIAQHLKRKPVSRQAERAWAAMSDNFEARFRFARGEDIPCFTIFSDAVLQAWEALAVASKKSGPALMTPGIVSSFRQKLSQMAPTAQNTTKQVQSQVIGVNSPASGHVLLAPSNTQIPLYNVEEDADLGMANVVQYPELYDWSLLDSDFNQLDWSAMDWNLSTVASGSTDGQ